MSAFNRTKPVQPNSPLYSNLQPSLRRKLFRSSPLSSPSKERYGDRFIPVRAGNNWETNFSSIPVSITFKFRNWLLNLKISSGIRCSAKEVFVEHRWYWRRSWCKGTERRRKKDFQVVCDSLLTFACFILSGKITSKCQEKLKRNSYPRCQWRHKRP